MIIRPFQPTDEEQLKRCIAVLKDYESQFDPDYLTTSEATNELFLEITKHIGENAQVYVAEEDNKLLGFISFEITNKNDLLIEKKVDAVYISDLVVLPEYRNSGIGKLLMQKAHEFAKEKAIHFVKLIICAGNSSARKFYQNLGYSDYETTLLKEL